MMTLNYIAPEVEVTSMETTDSVMLVTSNLEFGGEGDASQEQDD